MGASGGCQGVLYEIVGKADEYESDVSETGRAVVGSAKLSSGESSPSSASMSFGEGPPSRSLRLKKGRARARVLLSSSSGESLEQLCFIPRKVGDFVEGPAVAVDNSNEVTQLIVPEGDEDENMETEGGEGSGVLSLERQRNMEMMTPTRKPEVRAVLETPKKQNGNKQTLIQRRRPKSFNLPKMKGQTQVNLLKQRKLRHLQSSPSMITLGEVQEIVLRTVEDRMKPVEDLLSSISESIRSHISTTVKEEIKGAIGEFRSFLDGRLPVPRNNGRRTQQRQGRSKKPEADTPDEDETVQDKQANNGEERQKSSGENDKTVAVPLEKCSPDGQTADNRSTDTDPEAPAPSPSSTQELEIGNNRRIIWANKRIPSETLVEKLKKYVERKGDSMRSTPEKSFNFNSEPTEETATPPNSPVSNGISSPSTPPFTLGMVKIEPPDTDDDLDVPDEGDKVFTPLKTAVSKTSLDEVQTEDLTSEYITADSEPPRPKTDLIGFLGSSEGHNNHVISMSGIGPEKVPKPELPIRKPKESIMCEFCGKNFLNNSSLKQHMSFHRPQRPYQCRHPGCEKSYKTKSELNRHIIVHAGKKNYECKQCNKKFLRKQYLKTHLLRHSEPLTKQCSMCFKIFVSEQDLSKHRISYHKNGKRKCSRSSTSTSSNPQTDSSNSISSPASSC